MNEEQVVETEQTEQCSKGFEPIGRTQPLLRQRFINDFLERKVFINREASHQSVKAQVK